MDGSVALRLVTEDDLPRLERLTQDPDVAGEFAWLGWRDLSRFRQGWADNKLISDDAGVLMIVREHQRLGTCRGTSS